jgi:hypothetical protein
MIMHTTTSHRSWQKFGELCRLARWHAFRFASSQGKWTEIEEICGRIKSDAPLCSEARILIKDGIKDYKS